MSRVSVFFCLRPCLCVKKFEDGNKYMHLVANKRNKNTLIIHICMLDINRNIYIDIYITWDAPPPSNSEQGKVIVIGISY